MRCRICQNERIKEFLSLGISPLANNFLKREDLDKEEPRFPLTLCFCSECKLVQLSHVVDPEMMFRNYVYVSSTTQTFRNHFTQMAHDLTNVLGLQKGSLVVDIGSNDGLLLKGFQQRGVQVMGVEPATNIAKMAQEAGVDTVNDFFNARAVEEIIQKKGKADVVTANNVFAHIDDIHELIKNVKRLLKERGVFVIEIQYLGDMMEKMTFDNVYHEHLSYFTLIALMHFFNRVDMEVFNVQRVGTHGGSLRVFVQRKGGKHTVQKEVSNLLKHEKGFGLETFEAYQTFADKVYETKRELVQCIRGIKQQGKRIAAYGAPAKASTLLNFCGIGKDEIGYVVEDNPLKVGLFTPGTHIPVVGPEMLDRERPDYVVILAWNFADEILKKTKQYAEAGVKFIVPLPSLVIV